MLSQFTLTHSPQLTMSRILEVKGTFIRTIPRSINPITPGVCPLVVRNNLCNTPPPGSSEVPPAHYDDGGDDSIVPSTPTLFAPRRGFPEPVSSPQVIVIGGSNAAAGGSRR